MKMKFEDYLEAEEFKQLFNKANNSDKEVIKRALGFKSTFLGKGRTRNVFLRGALKLMVSVFIREPMEAKAQKRQKNEAPKAMDNLEDYDDIVRAENENETDAQIVNQLTNQEGTEEVKNDNGGFSQVNTNKICKHWTRNKCKKGSTCKFRHPDLCEKFSKFGPYQKLNHNGCDNSCNLLHLKGKWCFQAIKTGVCSFGKDCQYSHFRGVKQEKKSQKLQQPMQVTSSAKPTQMRQGPISGGINKPKLQPRSYASVTKGAQDPFLDKTSLGTVVMSIMARLDQMDQWMRGNHHQPWPTNSPWPHSM